MVEVAGKSGSFSAMAFGFSLLVMYRYTQILNYSLKYNLVCITVAHTHAASNNGIGLLQDQC